MTAKTPRDQWTVPMRPPTPPPGDEYTDARQIINEARLLMPEGSPRPEITGSETTAKKRVILAHFLRLHGVPVPPEPLPYQRGWSDTFTGRVVDPSETNGERFV